MHVQNSTSFEWNLDVRCSEKVCKKADKSFQDFVPGLVSRIKKPEEFFSKYPQVFLSKAPQFFEEKVVSDF